MSITYDQGLAIAREKAANADYGSPFRYRLTKLIPQYIRQYCPAHARVLDLGCGSGRYAYFFLEARIAGSYTGMDISADRFVELKLPETFPGRLLQYDAHELERFNEKFDFLLSLTAFEHFADDHRVMEGVAAVLEHGAHALIVVPSHYSYLLYGEHGYRRYNRSSISRLAREAGLEIVSLKNVGGLAGFLFHFHWFFPARVLQLIGRGLLYGIYDGNRDRARQAWPRLAGFLDNLGQHHLRWGWGRWLHKTSLFICDILDRYLRIFEAGYLVILRKASLKL